MPSRAPEARIRLFMDALIAEYDARVAVWHLMQNGSLALLALALLAWLTDELPSERFATVALAALAVVFGAARMLEHEERKFERRVLRLAEHLETMMRSAAP